MGDNLNLSPERGPNVWQKEGTTVESAGHGASAVAGAMMLAAGAAAAFFGGRRLYQAIRNVRGSGEAVRRTAPTSGQPIDLVDEESEASFPASDPPSWASSDGATLDRK